MSGITKHGRDEVKESMLATEVSLLKAKGEYENKLKRYDDLVKANACKHKNLRDAGSYMYNHTQCKDCDYTWID